MLSRSRCEAQAVTHPSYVTWDGERESWCHGPLWLVASPSPVSTLCYLPQPSLRLSRVTFHARDLTWLSPLSWPQVNTRPGPGDGMWGPERTLPPATGDGTVTRVPASTLSNDTHIVYANCRLLRPCKTPLFKVIISHQHFWREREASFLISSLLTPT